MSEFHRLKGAFRRFRAIVLGRDVEIVGHCRMCGRCCRKILLKSDDHWLKKETEFTELCQADPLLVRFRIMGRNPSGFLLFECARLGKDNICTEYESRPALCSNYPTKSLYYHGGWLRDDCGFSFQAVTFRDVFMRRKSWRKPKFADVLRGQIEQDKDKRTL
ncbi:YkgJ family cysteine cluster protein [Pseudodesulfovibrio sp. JC047]|uniref:YkgJ family cysteine cluster protein n=1 Tax=Pseudodesulfovibrio sp. JC047 TaxID=2683199 RepID=UPI0013D6144B|nr:YkgJ family cysteine cluster protein [Pseudodesulfovibrio sp. JC047]NDV18056.1 YkgJ family cysteine cluster protein [Pseudodesulfovibrio sp. JC047]